MTSTLQNRSLDLAPARVEVAELPDGSMLLRSPEPLAPYPATLSERLFHWARCAPARVFLTEPGPGPGQAPGPGPDQPPDAGAGTGPGQRTRAVDRTVTYAEAADAVARMAQALIDRGLLADAAARSVLILAGNGIDHALLQLAAMHVGIPVAPVSVAYSTASSDLAKLRAIADAVQPGLVLAPGPAFARAVAAIARPGLEALTDARAPLAPLMAAEPTAAVDAAHARTGPDTLAKLLFTSGSTGTPKGVENTQRMMCANQQAIAQVWRFLAHEPPVLVDWLPWSHTFGGNHNFNMVLFHGGTLHIDHGKPMPGQIEHTVDRLREHAPTLYFNVPRGFDMLLPFLEQDQALRQRFFSRVKLLFYAAAALPQSLWERLARVATAAGRDDVMMSSAWGATETAPMVTTVHYPMPHAGIIGLPAPGCELKLTPRDGKLEMRVRGPGVTPGYWKRPDLTAQVFDQDGYYCTGDAGRLAAADDPARGLVFDGRVAENFKLSSGTWVEVGRLRVDVIAAASPVVQDAVLAGEGRDAVALLVFPSLAGCRTIAGDDSASLIELVRHPAVRDHALRALQAFNAQNPHGSRRIARLVLMAEPASIDAGEITDKGYLNQRAVLACRAELVEDLYREPAPAHVIRVEDVP